MNIKNGKKECNTVNNYKINYANTNNTNNINSVNDKQSNNNKKTNMNFKNNIFYNCSGHNINIDISKSNEKKGKSKNDNKNVIDLNRNTGLNQVDIMKNNRNFINNIVNNRNNNYYNDKNNNLKNKNMVKKQKSPIKKYENENNKKPHLNIVNLTLDNHNNLNNDILSYYNQKNHNSIQISSKNKNKGFSNKKRK